MAPNPQLVIMSRQPPRRAGPQAPRTPVKPGVPAQSPWWGHEHRVSSAPTQSSGVLPSSGPNGAPVNLASLPKLGSRNHHPPQHPESSSRPSTPKGDKKLSHLQQQQQRTSSAPAGPPGTITPRAKSQLGHRTATPGAITPPRAAISAPTNDQRLDTSVPPPVISPLHGKECLRSVLPSLDPNTAAVVSRQGQPSANSSIPLQLPYLSAPPNKPVSLLNATRSSGGPVHQAPPRKIPENERYGLKSLSEVLRADSTGAFSPAVGVDVSTLGMTVRDPDEVLSETFASPWVEVSKHCVIPKYSLPDCYVVPSVVPQQQKLQNLTEETLFYIFYTMPRDAMQEAVAVELTNRNWRYHKELKLWLTKDPLSEPVQQNSQAESGVYVFFDPSSWEKVKKEYVLYYPDIA